MTVSSGECDSIQCAAFPQLERSPGLVFIGVYSCAFVVELFRLRLSRIALARRDSASSRLRTCPNLDAYRDWGYAREYVEAMWLMLQQDEPDDYVIATNETHPVREFLEAAFGHVGLDWKQYVEIDPRYHRPAEVELLIGDASKAKRKLGWEPKTKFVTLTKLMVDADIELLRRHREGDIRVAG